MRIFEKLAEEGPDDGADAFRRILLKERYVDPSRPDSEVDYFLFECVNLIQIFHLGRLFRRRAEKELKESAAKLHLGEASRYGEAGEEALYRELRNAADRYFDTCTVSGYRRGTFGLVNSTAQEKRRQMVKDAWEMSLGVTRKFRAEDTFAVWNRAVRDELFRGDPEAEILFREYDAKHNR